VSAELEVLQDIADRFERAGIAYMLTGSVALSYYAEPRMTRDINLVVELAGRDPAQLAGMFAPDYYISEADVHRGTGGICRQGRDRDSGRGIGEAPTGDECRVEKIGRTLVPGDDCGRLGGRIEEGRIGRV